MSSARTTPYALAAGALLTAGLTLAPTAAQAAPEQVMRERDATGDVRIFAGQEGLTTAERTSIDIEKVVAKRRDDGTVRFVVDLADVRRTQKFEQMVFVSMRTTADAETRGEADLGISAQSPELGFAYRVQGRAEKNCDPITSTTLFKRDVLRVDVPAKCMPVGPVTVKVTSVTGYFRSEGPGWSRDVLKVADPVVFVPEGIEARRR